MKKVRLTVDVYDLDGTPLAHAGDVLPVVSVDPGRITVSTAGQEVTFPVNDGEYVNLDDDGLDSLRLL